MGGVGCTDRGGTRNDQLDDRVAPLGLSDVEVADLAGFLRALESRERPGLGDPAAPARPAMQTVRILDLAGRPVVGETVHVVPCGDRLRGADVLPEPFDLTTDSQGEIQYATPLSTQIRFTMDRRQVANGLPIPDVARAATLLASWYGTAALIVHRGGSTPGFPLEITVELGRNPHLEARLEDWGGVPDAVRSRTRPWRLTRGAILDERTVVYLGSTQEMPDRPAMISIGSGIFGPYEMRSSRAGSVEVDLDAPALPERAFLDSGRTFTEQENADFDDSLCLSR